MNKIISLEKPYFDPILESKKILIQYRFKHPVNILEKLGYTCYNTTIEGLFYNFHLAIDVDDKKIHVDAASDEKTKTFLLAHALGKIIYKNNYLHDLQFVPLNLVEKPYGLDKDIIEIIKNCNRFAALLTINKDTFLNKYNPLVKYDVEEHTILNFLSKHFKLDESIIEFLKQTYVGENNGEN